MFPGLQLFPRPPIEALTCLRGIDKISVTKGDTCGVTVRQDNSKRITVAFPYNPLLVAKVKTIHGHRWHPEEKHWSFPDTDGTLEKILKVFEGEEILFVEHVPADVCTKCGEKMYSPEVTDELMRFAKEESKPVKTVNVPVYDFACHQ